MAFCRNSLTIINMSRRPRGGYFNNRAQGRSERGSQGRGERPPPHLKGRDIGLWYAQRSKQRKEAEEGVVALEPDISLNPDKIQEIRRYLSECEFLGQQQQNLPRQIGQPHTFHNDFLRATTNNIEEQIMINIIAKDEATASDVVTKSKLDEKLQEQYAIGLSDDNSDLQVFRRKLPCWKKRAEIVDMIRRNQVVLIKGETGCGKTTQVTQYLLDDFIASGNGSRCRIVCTQPRRISGKTNTICWVF